MEMRAREDTAMAQDLIAPISPIAASLHDRFLSTCCSSCFRPLPNPRNAPSAFIPCAACDASILYCSLACRESDVSIHSSSGECLLILLLAQQDPSTWLPGDSSDLRAALRILRSLETLGLLVPRAAGRIGWLSLTDLDVVLGEGPESEIGERIRQGAALMRRAREGKGAGAEAGREEEEALWAVITNAVEVQVSEAGPLGIGVYGPWFSWFNHSCSPNACYRFELASWTQSGSLDSCDPSLFKVIPASNAEAAEVWQAWVDGGSNLTKGLHGYGPRIVARSIKRIKRGGEVCIAYTDLLQPKAMRQSDLWCKYRFICCCERCSASPEIYVDYVLKSDARSLVGNNDGSGGKESDELAEVFEQTIAEFMSDGSPEACCRKLENMLFGTSKDSTSKEPSKLTFRLHPLHYLSLNAYIALSSACRILSTNLRAGGPNNMITFKMARATAAYSLLLACATHFHFMSEPSLIASTAIFLINAGESIIGLLRASCEVKLNFTLQRSEFSMDNSSYMSVEKCRKASIKFLECISKNVERSWLYLVQGLSYLEDIRNPADFSWLGVKNICGIDCLGWTSNFCLCCQYEVIMDACLEEHRMLARVAVCCLAYGRYLATICWGQQSYLADKVGNLFHVVR